MCRWGGPFCSTSTPHTPQDPFVCHDPPTVGASGCQTSLACVEAMEVPQQDIPWPREGAATQVLRLPRQVVVARSAVGLRLSREARTTHTFQGGCGRQCWVVAVGPRAKIWPSLPSPPPALPPSLISHCPSSSTPPLGVPPGWRGLLLCIPSQGRLAQALGASGEARPHCLLWFISSTSEGCGSTWPLPGDWCLRTSTFSQQHSDPELVPLGNGAGCRLPLRRQQLHGLQAPGSPAVALLNRHPACTLLSRTHSLAFAGKLPPLVLALVVGAGSAGTPKPWCLHPPCMQLQLPWSIVVL